MHYACLDLNFYTLLYTMHVWPIESYIELTLFAPFCDSLAFLFIYLFLLHVRQACTLLFIRRFIF